MPWWAHAIMGIAAVFTAGAALAGLAPAMIGAEVAAEGAALGAAEAGTAVAGEVAAETAATAGAEIAAETTAATTAETTAAAAAEGSAEATAATTAETAIEGTGAADVLAEPSFTVEGGVEVSGAPEAEFTAGLDPPYASPTYYSELAGSIANRGQLQAILVRARKDGSYDIVAGQRRFMAIESLGWKSMRAKIADSDREDIEYKIDSFTENLLREDMSQMEKIEVCTALHRTYGSAKLVAEKTGIPYQTVLELVKYDRLDEQLKDMVKNQGLDTKLALQAQDSVTNPSTGKIDVKKGLILVINECF